VKLTPKAKRAGITGVEQDGEGRAYLKVAVTAAPEGGKANTALIALLAKTWRVPKSSLAVVKGETARMKELAFTGDPAPVTAWIQDHISRQQ